MRPVLARVAILALVLAACGGSESADTTSTAAAPPTTAAVATTEATTPTTAPAATTTAPSTAGVTLVVTASSLGDIVTDGEGNTLYLFKPDAAAESTCYGGCEDNWPPLTAEVTAGTGIDSSLIGSTQRTDGSFQVTYNGWPLYYFAADGAPGDTNGQGINDVWFVVSSIGEAIE